MLSVTVGVSLFLAGFAFTALRKSNLRTFTLGICAGAASLSQYAVIGVSTVAAAGLLVLIIAPVCGLVGLSAGIFLALFFRARIRPSAST
jgi:CrcB protein